jgi:hypothetical protein
VASIVSGVLFLKTWVTCTSAMGPLIDAITSVDMRGKGAPAEVIMVPPPEGIAGMVVLDVGGVGDAERIGKKTIVDLKRSPTERV